MRSATCCGTPLAVLAIDRYLGGYAYHISVSWMVFPGAALAALLLAWATVGYESMKAARVNPSRSLRAE